MVLSGLKWWTERPHTKVATQLPVLKQTLLSVVEKQLEESEESKEAERRAVKAQQERQRLGNPGSGAGKKKDKKKDEPLGHLELEFP